ncbi:20375_t:CDS:2 [Cetraspora pellucida]|uniref:protein-ribulosamine 3-kinase n=1 Tax=Cetraspora pellucida TaxID=1433469 RepID=A0A9N9D5K2_9GLOM|nr:20375_t:CDS:2 [Cetraspora pellucida]
MSQIDLEISNILSSNGICTKIFNISPISGGCVSSAFKFSTDNGDFFVKTSKTQNSKMMFEGEAESLRAIVAAVPGFTSQPLYVGSLLSGGAFLVTTFFRLSTSHAKNVQILLGQKLSTLHMTESPNGLFGFPVVTMCGTTEQDNTWEKDWETFYKKRRLSPIINKCLQNNPWDTELRKLGDIVIDKVVHHLLKDVEVKPVLIHGDLWSGNWGINSVTNEPVIFDPASFYGHNEMELSIMTMFGSPSRDFFNEYHTHHPRQEPAFKQRQDNDSS